MRRLAAVTAGKTARMLSQLGGFRGSSLPGRVSLALDPSLLRAMASQVRRDTVMVTGTNGKTTTSNMIGHVLRSCGRTVVSNSEGANMAGGMVTAFVARSSLWGRIRCDHAILESDEGHFPALLAEIGASTAVVTNFFRDQLDRYGEIDTTVSAIAGGLERIKPQLVLNADDPVVMSLQATGAPTLTYGLDDSGTMRRASHAREGRFCPSCQSVLDYSRYHYGQLGHYLCPRCGFRRPDPAVSASGVREEEGRLWCRIRFPDGEHEMVLPTRGVYNLHNALAAAAACLHLGVPAAEIVAALGAFRHATGRLQTFTHRGRTVVLNLVKNPAGFNEALGLLLNQQGAMDVLLALNDNIADGRDVSWIFDADMEMLVGLGDRIGRIVCSGVRAEEMALRIRYAGVGMDKVEVEHDFRPAISRVLGGAGGSVYMLCTYTAVWPVERILRRRLGGGSR